MILHLIPDNVDGCAYHRVLVPSHNLDGFDLAQTTFVDGIEDEDLKKMALVVFNRDSGVAEPEKQIKRLRRLKIPYVMDVDDLWETDKTHLLYKHFKLQGAQRITTLLKGAHTVTTTNARLARKVERFNRNVVVVPNAIDKKQDQWNENKYITESPVFGWVGGIHHIADVDSLRDAFARIHIEKKVNLALGGFTNNEVYMAFDNWFSNNQTYPHYKRIGATDVYNYGNIYNSIDVALIPLLESKFNACKSNLKLLEAGAKGLPAICSRVAPYTDDFTDKEVLFVDGRSGWYDAIMKMNNEPQLLFDYKSALSEKVKEYEIEKINVIRKQLYNRIING